MMQQNPSAAKNCAVLSEWTDSQLLCTQYKNADDVKECYSDLYAFLVKNRFVFQVPFVRLFVIVVPLQLFNGQGFQEFPFCWTYKNIPCTIKKIPTWR